MREGTTRAGLIPVHCMHTRPIPRTRESHTAALRKPQRFDKSDGGPHQMLVELREARLAMVVDHEDPLDHGC